MISSIINQAKKFMTLGTSLLKLRVGNDLTIRSNDDFSLMLQKQNQDICLTEGQIQCFSLRVYCKPDNFFSTNPAIFQRQISIFSSLSLSKMSKLKTYCP